MFRLPKSRQDFWDDKISSNRVRDSSKQKQLFDLGWRVGVIWECAIRGKAALDQSELLAGLNGFICGEARFFELRGFQV
jgi:DNA mismatch endonuclease (patch repair protein)